MPPWPVWKPLCVCFVWLGVFSPAEAESTPVVKVATGQQYLPFVDESAPSGGWSAAIVKAAFEATERPFEVHTLPSWPKAYQQTLANHYDALFPYVYTAKRDTLFHYSNPINVSHIRYYVAAQSDIRHTKDTQGKCFCLPEGYEMAQNIARIQAPYQYEYRRKTSPIDCALSVEKQTCDVGFIDRQNSLDRFSDRRGRLLNLRLLPDTVGRVTLHLLIPKSHPHGRQLLESFNRGLSLISQNGLRQSIDQRFRQRQE